jgi:hypothetical protein
MWRSSAAKGRKGFFLNSNFVVITGDKQQHLSHNEDLGIGCWFVGSMLIKSVGS